MFPDGEHVIYQPLHAQLIQFVIKKLPTEL